MTQDLTKAELLANQHIKLYPDGSYRWQAGSGKHPGALFKPGKKSFNKDNASALGARGRRSKRIQKASEAEWKTKYQALLVEALRARAQQAAPGPYHESRHPDR